MKLNPLRVSPSRFGLLGVLCLLFSVSSATTVTDEYQLLRKIPLDRLRVLRGNTPPDRDGHVGGNVGGWTGAGAQRAACWHLIAAVVAGDLTAADDGWRAIDTAFQHQQSDGGFADVPIPESAHKDPRTMRVQSAFFFIQELTHAILVIRQSPHADHFAARIESLLPRISLAAAYIDAGYDTILQNSTAAVNRLFIAAKALGFSGVILSNPRFIETSRRLVAHALRQRDADGIFLEHGGRDSSYNVVSVFFGLTLAMHVDYPEIVAACGPAMEWQLTRIKPSGEVDVSENSRTGVGLETLRGIPKGVNYPEVIMSFYLMGLMTEDTRMLAMADRIYQWHQKKK